MILLDTNALIWLDRGHSRVRKLAQMPRMYISPANLLELQVLVEAGRVRLTTSSLAALAADSRWTLDDPPAASWFEKAWDLGWTRDPFDRLLVAHAHLRGWRLATSDGPLASHLDAADVIEL